MCLKRMKRERYPICLHNLKAAQKNADDMMIVRKKYDPEADPERFAKANAELARQHIHSLGISMGYAYFNSELTLLLKGQATEPMNSRVYQPIVAPGYFLPHCRLANQKSIYDVLSPIHWTLIVSGNGVSTSIKEFQDHVAKFTLPLKTIFLPDHTYSYPYILIRPDWHIAFVSHDLQNDYKAINGFFSSNFQKNNSPV